MATYILEISFVIKSQKHESEPDKIFHLNFLFCFMIKSDENSSLDTDLARVQSQS
jgi:hypothetical protein